MLIRIPNANGKPMMRGIQTTIIFYIVCEVFCCLSGQAFMSFEAINSADMSFSSGTSDHETVQLTANDVLGTQLDEPFDKHTMVRLHQWLFCHGIKASTSWKKSYLVAR